MASKARSRAETVGVNTAVVGMVCHLECRTGAAKVGDAAVVATIVSSARVATSAGEVVGLPKGLAGADERHKDEDKQSVQQVINQQEPLRVRKVNQQGVQNYNRQEKCEKDAERANDTSPVSSVRSNTGSTSTEGKIEAFHDLRTEDEREQKGNKNSQNKGTGNAHNHRVWHV